MSIVEYESGRIEGMDGVTVTPLQSKDFILTDEKSTLLLKVVHQHKTMKILSGIDWETIQPKYSGITTSHVQKYPN